MSTADDLRHAFQPKIRAALEPLLRGHDDHICIIDPPGHANVGDNAILLGELDYIDEHHPKSRTSFYDVGNYTAKADRHIDEASILLLHGGGNFGDLWPRHHAIRKTILRNFRHKRIVQLPQSISFSDDAELRETQTLVDAHPDFHLIVRDEKNYAFALKNFSCEVSLAPDMAFAMQPIRRKPARLDAQCLLRGDKEVVADHEAITATLTKTGASFAVDDWLEDPETLSRRLDRKLNVISRNHPSLTALFQPQMMWTRRLYARRRLDVGIALLSRGRYVVTDRLHAHILSSLLDIPNFVFNSLDGKIGAFHAAWMEGRAHAWIVESPAVLDRRLEEAGVLAAK
jgi:exopolysaccharide biosynthesis predicted pyruvyltransferase EpsI